MLDFLFSHDFMSHGHCYLWKPGLLGLHVGSDLIIGFSYVLISALLWVFVQTAKKEVIPFRWMFAAFGAFIILCGMTHFMEVITVWKAYYWLSGVIKALTS